MSKFKLKGAGRWVADDSEMIAPHTAAPRVFGVAVFNGKLFSSICLETHKIFRVKEAKPVPSLREPLL